MSGIAVGFIFSPDFDSENAKFLETLDNLYVPYILYMGDDNLGGDLNYPPDPNVKLWIYRGGINNLHKVRMYFRNNANLADSYRKDILLYDFCNLPEYQYDKYSHRVKLLNSDYCILPFGELKKIEYIDTFFIRPLSGAKTSPAGVIKKSYLKTFQDIYKIYDSDLFVAATRRDILKEWRFIVINGEIVGGSKYQVLDDELFEKVGEDQFPYTAVKRLISPSGVVYNTSDNMFTVDVCTVLNQECGIIESKVVEINSVTCAGWYACDYDVIVKALIKEAKRKFEEEN